MRRSLDRSQHLSVWNRRINSAFWALALSPLLWSGLVWMFVRVYNQEQAGMVAPCYALLQTGMMLGGLAVVWIMLRWKSIWQDYIILTYAILFSAVVWTFNASHAYSVQLIMVLPILLSILYFNRIKIWFATGGVLLVYAGMSAASVEQQIDQHVPYFWIGGSVVLGAALAAAGIVNRGLRLIADEREAALNERRHRLQQQAIEEAFRKDPLTGLDNHKTFQSRIRLMIENRDNLLALAIIDIDNFKAVNDTFGHSAGDMVLRKVGTLLREREGTDIFPSRYGGEEFTLIMAGRPQEEINRLLERLRAETEELALPELEGKTVTVSIGCCMLERDDTLDEWFRLADEALYRAKRTGKNKVVWSERNVTASSEGGSHHD